MKIMMMRMMIRKIWLLMIMMIEMMRTTKMNEKQWNRNDN